MAEVSAPRDGQVPGTSTTPSASARHHTPFGKGEAACAGGGVLSSLLSPDVPRASRQYSSPFESPGEKRGALPFGVDEVLSFQELVSLIRIQGQLHRLAESN